METQLDRIELMLTKICGKLNLQGEKVESIPKLKYDGRDFLDMREWLSFNAKELPIRAEVLRNKSRPFRRLLDSLSSSDSFKRFDASEALRALGLIREKAIGKNGYVFRLAEVWEL